MCVRRCPTFPPGLGSIIGAGRLSFRVRDGSGRFPVAISAVTLFSCVGAGPSVGGCHCVTKKGVFGGGMQCLLHLWRCGCETRCGAYLLVFNVPQKVWGWLLVSFRPVSASSLHTLRCFQVWSINPVVCGGPYPSKRVRILVLE